MASLVMARAVGKIAMTMKKRASVTLIVETSGVYGRQILHGVSRYLNTHGGWSVFVDEREGMAPPPKWLLDWNGDGIICRSTTPSLAHALKKRRIAVVDLNERYGYLGLPYIASDMPAIGRMATEHLLERGFKNIAYAGFSEPQWSKGRLKGVQEALHGRGQLCSVFESPTNVYRTKNWLDERNRICEWVQTLPRPIGIVACNDRRGQHVLEACRMLGVSVPDEISVVGVDNTETLCELCSPPLSSVMPDAERIGFEAATLLARLMEGDSKAEAQTERISIAPREVVARQSSEVWAIDDPVFSRAIRFIREHACDRITVDDVLAHARTSRSTLERSIRHHLGHSPQTEIRIIRLKRVKQLLEETSFSLPRIAEIAGFEHPEYMMAQFKRLVGQTPSQWRESHLP
ncbi:xylose operon regulatory protein [Abditibacteriota bacterium]|nr:xylose operon regulatory protein [Abditibacteriota bacterium]